jgi:hypothetical protein
VDKPHKYCYCYQCFLAYVDNLHRFSAKLVNLYLTTFRYDEWEKFSQELQDMDVTVANFTQTLRSVDQRIQVRSLFFPTKKAYR